MRTVLVGPGIEENLALAYLGAAIRRAGHEATIVRFDRRADVRRCRKEVVRAKPDLIGLSLVAQRRYRDVQELIDAIRRAGFQGHITAGGHFASLRAPEVLRDTPGLDTILHHDGEERIVGLLRILTSRAGLPGDLDGVSWRGADGAILHAPATRVADLDALPYPTRRKPDRSLGYARAPIVSSRGCAGSCSFCSIHAWHRQVPSGRLRFRSPESVADEMASLHRDHGVRVFIFHDDDFVHPDKSEAFVRCRRVFEAARRAIGEPFAFVIKCRPDDVEENLFRYLAGMGLARVYVGIETHAESGIAALNRRVRPETNLQALETLRKLGIYACFNLLLFHPETTIQELRQNLAFLEGQLDHPFDVARAELYARSPLEEWMLDAGRAVGDYRGYGYRISDPLAETVFRLFADVLWDRHFAGSSILHRVQDLGFRLSLLGKISPNSVPTDLARRVQTLIRDINGSTVGYLRRLMEVAEAEDPARVIRALRGRIRSDLRGQWARLAALSIELDCRASLARTGIASFAAAARLPGLIGRIVSAPGLTMLMGSLACSSCSEGPQVCDPPPPPYGYSRDIEPQFAAECATAQCHSTDAAAGGLVLAAGAGHGNLVDVPSVEVPRLDRVEPAQPDSSYLLHKLKGTQATVGGTGDQMPKDGPPDYLLAYQVERWIAEGAEDD